MNTAEASYGRGSATGNLLHTTPPAYTPGMAADSSSVDISEDELAASVLAIHILRGRTTLADNQVSGWRRAARAEAIGQASADWGRKGRLR